MRDGRIVQADTPDRVYRAPADTAVAAFVGGAVVLPATITAGTAACALGTLTADRTGRDADVVEGEILIRPEQIELHDEDAAGVAARVVRIDYFGHEAAVQLEVLGSATPVAARVLGADLPSVGAIVRLAVRGDVRVYTPGATENVHEAAAHRYATSRLTLDRRRTPDATSVVGHRDARDPV